MAKKKTNPILDYLVKDVSKKLEESKEKKKGIDPNWIFYKYVNYVLENKKLVGLIMAKVSSSVIPTYKGKLDYLYSYYAIDKRKCSAHKKKLLKSVDDILNYHIEALKVIIEAGLKWIVQRWPKGDKWVSDVFGEDAKVYLLDINITKRKRKPDYEKSLAILRKFLSGDDYRKLGLIKQEEIDWKLRNKINTGHFCARTRPQALVKLLRIPHVIIYETPKVIEKHIENASRPRFKDALKLAFLAKASRQ